MNYDKFMYFKYILVVNWLFQIISSWTHVFHQFSPNLLFCKVKLKGTNMIMVYFDVNYEITSWITFFYALVINYLVIEVWSPMKGKKVWLLTHS